uniref:Silicatein yellow variant n=1 Tax=Tethya aurantium TaxID=281732 RepID=G8YY08_TETAR|nr:silicatein yellow variant [Tethya aurantium]
MYSIALVIVCVLATAIGQPTIHYEFKEEWQLWKNQHSKSYQTELEELEKHLVWLSNKKYIELHNANADTFGFSLAMNHLGDMTDYEYQEKYLTYQNSNSKSGNYTKVFQREPWMTDPETVDWRTKGAVTNIKNQGDCGASYAFSAMGALEGASALATGKLIPLSEQNIIDCSVPYGNHGCKGGNMYIAFKYVIANDGVDSETSYPYGGKQSSCTYKTQNSVASMSGSIQIKYGSETDLEAAVANNGPVAVAIDGSSNAFRFYFSGVYDSSRCSSSYLNHAMVITGYGISGDQEYWLAKNSWGTNWGEEGYVKMARNKYNQCGIASDASFPSL